MENTRVFEFSYNNKDLIIKVQFLLFQNFIEPSTTPIKSYEIYEFMLLDLYYLDRTFYQNPWTGLFVTILKNF